MKVLFATLILASLSLALAKNVREKAAESEPTTSASVNASKLPIRIYYESLCPDSRKLLNDLGREYHSFKKYIALEFVPFGRAESLDAAGNEFKCHHGEKECVSNRIHSCGVQHLTNQDAQQQFVVCQMNAKSEDTGKEVRDKWTMANCLIILWKAKVFWWKLAAYGDKNRCVFVCICSASKKLAVNGDCWTNVWMVVKANSCNYKPNVLPTKLPSPNWRMCRLLYSTMYVFCKYSMNIRLELTEGFMFYFFTGQFYLRFFRATIQDCKRRPLTAWNEHSANYWRTKKFQTASKSMLTSIEMLIKKLVPRIFLK